jgi:hypothetical protein
VGLVECFPRLVALDHVVLLSRGDGSQQVASDMLVSDGTAAGTFSLTSRVPALAGFAGDAGAKGDPQLTPSGGAAYFFGTRAGGTPAVWRTDGTAAGTQPVHAFPAGTALKSLGVVDGLAYFSAGDQLWRTDGTDAGTEPVFDGPATAVAGGGGRVLFSGADAPYGNELRALPQEKAQVFVRGSAWAAPFNAYLQGNALGDFGYGYRVDDKPAGGVLPWLNVNQVVLRLTADEAGRGAPTQGAVTIQSQRGGAYAVTRVDPVASDPQAFVFTLDRPLGGDGADPSRNGDRLTLTVAGAGPGNADLVVHLNVLQGDVDGDGTVLAEDFAAVKKRFFTSAGSPLNATDPSAGYSPFHDVDGSGSILAADYSEVKKRFFQTFPSEPTAAAAVVTTQVRRGRPVTRDWFASGSPIA